MILCMVLEKTNINSMGDFSISILDKFDFINQGQLIYIRCELRCFQKLNLLWSCFLINKLIMVSQSQLQLYDQLSHYARNHKIQLQVFWTCPRYCLTFTQFNQLLQAIGFVLTPKQQQDLIDYLVQFVSLQTVISHVQYWKQKQTSVGAFASKQARAARQQRFANKNKQAPAIAKSNKTKALDQKWQKQWQLNQTLIRSKNETDYQLTVKVGQANDLCKLLKNNTSYIVENSNKNSPSIVEQGKQGQKVLTRKAFQQVFQKMKLQSLSRAQEFQGSLQQDLKKTLVEVMYLSGQLQQQIKLLQKKGITH